MPQTINRNGAQGTGVLSVGQAVRFLVPLQGNGNSFDLSEDPKIRRSEAFFALYLSTLCSRLDLQLLGRTQLVHRVFRQRVLVYSLRLEVECLRIPCLGNAPCARFAMRAAQLGAWYAPQRKAQMRVLWRLTRT